MLIGILPPFFRQTFNFTNMHKQIPSFLLLLFVGFQPVIAQKHDFMWPLGLGTGWSDYNFFLDFKYSDTPNIVIRTDTMSTGVYLASYCNSSGEIVLYSNGLWILNKNGELVENSHGLNPTLSDWQYYSYPGGQSGFFLQKPGYPNLIYFISLDFGLHPAGLGFYKYVGKNLMVATIDLTANNGLGKVLEKNRVLLTGTLMAPAACRHANGRDWWIMVSDADENRHYSVMLTPTGFSVPDTQHIGTKPNPIPYNGSNTNNQIVGNCFSPHGHYYADINDKLGFSIFEFDRCSGLLSNEKRENLPPRPTDPSNFPYGSGTGAVFSDNEQFFYKTTTNPGAFIDFVPNGTRPYLYQYDLNAQDLAASRDTINILDSADYNWPYNITFEKFLGAEIGPDGRIYIVHSGLGYSTVQYPNVKGKGCKLVHDKPFFDVVIGSAIPYMPNYRLGPLDSSPCDTLGLNNIPVANFRIDDTLGFMSHYFYDLSHHEPAIWLWDFGDGTGSSEQSPLHQYDSTGIYEVCLTVSNQYGSDTYCRTLYLDVSSTENPVQENRVVVLPNPFSQRLVVYLDETHHNPVFLLYDAAGQLVHKEPIANGIHEMQLKDLNNGMYFWEIVNNSERVRTGKVIKAD